MQHVDVSSVGLERLREALLPERADALLALGEQGRRKLAGRVVWNVSSTAGGGGVAEMLQGFLRYVRGAGVDTRWVVIEGDPDFFAVTKRLHNLLHDSAGDDGALGDREREAYLNVTTSSAEELLSMVGDRDIVILHDPQVAGLIPPVRERGLPAIWRCHVGIDETTELTDQAWAFLREWIDDADLSVFSRASYVPDWFEPAKVRVIPPALDPLSPKNEVLDDQEVLGILGRAGVLASDASASEVPRADVVREGGPLDPAVPLVVQVSRWDRLKDMPGVMGGFVDGGVARATGAHLMLVGPAVAGVADDPEGREVFDECCGAWHALAAADRASVSLVTVPMDDLDQNAAVINAVQRHAQVIVQKSLQEGFGLTVSEAMWKARPVIASAVGGIRDQVRDGVDGVLLDDPADLDAFARACVTLLSDPDGAKEMGERGHQRVRERFLVDRDLGQWLELIDDLDGA